MGSCVVYETIYNNGSYLLLFGKRKWQSLEISYELPFLLWNKRHPLLSATLQEAPHPGHLSQGLRYSQLTIRVSRFLRKIYQNTWTVLFLNTENLWWDKMITCHLVLECIFSVHSFRQMNILLHKKYKN